VAEEAKPAPPAEAEAKPAPKAEPEVAKKELPPVKTKEPPKPAAAAQPKKEPEPEHSDGEMMHQHPKDCFLTLWPGIVSVRRAARQRRRAGNRVCAAPAPVRGCDSALLDAAWARAGWLPSLRGARAAR